MKKRMLAVVVTWVFFTSSFAATGKGYRILDSEIHSTPGSNFHVEDVPPGTAAAQKKTPIDAHTKTSVPAP